MDEDESGEFAQEWGASTEGSDLEGFEINDPILSLLAVRDELELVLHLVVILRIHSPEMRQNRRLHLRCSSKEFSCPEN